jgi:hypothetical protein
MQIWRSYCKVKTESRDVEFFPQNTSQQQRELTSMLCQQIQKQTEGY